MNFIFNVTGYLKGLSGLLPPASLNSFQAYVSKLMLQSHMLTLCELNLIKEGNRNLATKADQFTCQAQVLSPQQYNIGTVITLILQMRKLKLEPSPPRYKSLPS